MTPANTLRALAVALLLCAASAPSEAQDSPQQPAQPQPAPEAASPLGQLAWLEGCWRGSVNQREFREQWLPLRGGVMLGVNHTVMDGKTVDFDYLRIESRADGIYYVITPPDAKGIAYKLGEVTSPDGDTVFPFANPTQEFPREITYRRNTEGWLYATVDGKVSGTDRQVIYPMRRIGCESGEVIRK